MANKANLKIALLANRASRHGKAGYAFAFFLRQVNRVLFCCDIGIGANIDPSCVFHHSGLGCVIHSDAVVGANCRFFQHVTIGSAWRGGSWRARSAGRQRRPARLRLRPARGHRDRGWRGNRRERGRDQVGPCGLRGRRHPREGSKARQRR